MLAACCSVSLFVVFVEERRLRDEAVAVAAVKSRMEEKAKAEENALSQAERGTFFAEV